MKDFFNGLSELSYQPSILVGGRLVSMFDLIPYCPDDTVFLNNLIETKEWIKQYVEVEKSNAIL